MNAITTDEEFDRGQGLRLMQLRLGRKMSREQLGFLIGVRGQQIQKYETGENRMTGARIAACARALNAPVGFRPPGSGSDTRRRRFCAISCPGSCAPTAATARTTRGRRCASREIERAVLDRGFGTLKGADSGHEAGRAKKDPF